MKKGEGKKAKDEVAVAADSEPLPYNQHLLLTAGAMADDTVHQIKRPLIFRRAIWGGVLVGLCISLIGGIVYWQVGDKGSFGKLSLAGLEISRKQPNAALEEQLKEKVAGYKVAVLKPDGSRMEYSLEQLGVSVNIPEAVSEAKIAKEQGFLTDRLQWWQRNTLPLRVNIDGEKLQKFIDEEATVVTEPAVNAALIINNGETSITAAKPGKGYIDPGARDKIIKAASELTPLELKLKSQALKPKISDNAINNLKIRVDKILAQTITLRLNGRQFSPTKSDMATWIDLPDFNTAKRADIEVNSGNIVSYIDKVTKAYVKPARSQVVMKSPEGQSVVLVKGRDGVGIVNKEGISVAITQNLLATNGFDEELAVGHDPFGTVQAESYPKWLVADITNKRMYAYEGPTLVHTFLISAGGPSYPTVLGEYKIRAKIRKQDMRGLNVDGSSYFQANVEWVNYFYGAYAIHGNYWRPPSWFGNVNSSHGCIGLQNHDAKWVYDWAPVGTPVITH